MSARKPHTEAGFVWCIVHRDGRYWHPRRKLAGSPNVWVTERNPWTDYVSRSAALTAYSRLGFSTQQAVCGIGGPAFVRKFPQMFDPPRRSPSKR
jgi:hypothetical protein